MRPVSSSLLTILAGLGLAATSFGEASALSGRGGSVGAGTLGGGFRGGGFRSVPRLGFVGRGGRGFGYGRGFGGYGRGGYGNSYGSYGGYGGYGLGFAGGYIGEGYGYPVEPRPAPGGMNPGYVAMPGIREAPPQPPAIYVIGASARAGGASRPARSSRASGIVSAGSAADRDSGVVSAAPQRLQVGPSRGR